MTRGSVIADFENVLCWSAMVDWPTHRISSYYAPLRAGLFSFVLFAVRVVPCGRWVESGHEVATFALLRGDLPKKSAPRHALRCVIFRADSERA
jgi:hypothetical protein